MTDAAGIVQFIAAQLDADEAAIEAIEDRSEPWRGEWEIKNSTLYTYNGWCLAAYGNWNPDVLRHIVRWDPARALAEIAAKRRILERHANYDFPYNPDDGPGDYAWTPSCDECHEPWPCLDVRDVAAPYADRKGWKDE